MKGVQSGNGKGWHPFDFGVDSILTGWAGPIPKAAYVAWYKMNEGTGTTFVDSIAANNAPFLSSIGSWSANLFTFNQTGFATASNPTPTEFNSNTPFSVSFWYNTAYPGSQQGIVGNLNSSLNGWLLQADNGYINLYLGTYTSTYMSVSCGSPIPTSVTSHVVMTYNGSSAATGVTFYADATASTSILWAGTGANTASLPLSIGGSAYSAGINYLGTIQDIRIFNTVLNQTQINYLYNGGPK